jgi:hypothetical protein
VAVAGASQRGGEDGKKGCEWEMTTEPGCSWPLFHPWKLTWGHGIRLERTTLWIYPSRDNDLYKSKFMYIPLNIQRIHQLSIPAKQLGIISKCLSWYVPQENLHDARDIALSDKPIFVHSIWP